MRGETNLMKKLLIGGGLTVFVFALSVSFAFAATPNWNVTGTYNINVNYSNVDYPETLILTQSGGNITGVSLDTVPPASLFTVTGGSVSGDYITIDANQGALVIQMVGTIKPDGSMSGNWGDVTEQLGLRKGTWETTSGKATAIICSENVLVSDTSTQFVGLTTTNPLNSSSNSSFTLGTPGAAVVAGPDGFPGAWTALITGAEWVSNNVIQPTDLTGGADNSWRLFSDSFKIPANATYVSSPVLHLAADNSVQAFLDGNSVGTASSFTTVTDSSPITITTGSHTFKFVVKNDAYDGPFNPTGLLYETTINYCVPKFPTTKDQCKKGGWEDFGIFKNQGDCVSFVATKGKNQPAGQ